MLVKQIDIFADLSEIELKVLSSMTQLLDVQKGEYLFYESDAPKYFFGVLIGKVHLLKHDLSGRNIILNVIEPGDTVGVVAVVNQVPHASSAMAAKDCQVLKIPAEPFLVLLKNNQKLSQKIIKLLAGRLKQANCMMQALSNDDVETRISSILWKHYVHHRGLKSAEPVFYLTRQNIADMAGTTVETTIRILKKWEENRWISFPHRGQMKILDIDHLHQASEIAHTPCCEREAECQEINKFLSTH